MIALDALDYSPVAISRDQQPLLTVVIDAEEEFDWNAPFSRDARSAKNIGQMPRLFDALSSVDCVPLCVMSHPVIVDPAASKLLRRTDSEGVCELGTHLHSWVTPPYEEQLTPENSYGCNLPAELERRKLCALTDCFAQNFDVAPTMFRTGRYGVGARTFKILAELGYRTDLSLPPHSSFTGDGGPSFYGWSNVPFWADEARELLSLPVTTGFSGAASGIGPNLAPFIDRYAATQAHVPGFLARTGLLERSRLTPEGRSFAELRRLLDALVSQGERVLTLSLHSSTLLAGATVYAEDEADVQAFTDTLTASLRYFVEELGGKLASVSAVDALLRGEQPCVCRTLRATA